MMSCPHCRSPEHHRVLETRASPHGVRRRHRCRTCKLTFVTYNGTVALPAGRGPTAVAAAIVKAIMAA
jgi:transcriptional regulator NrdR family protein